MVPECMPGNVLFYMATGSMADDRWLLMKCVLPILFLVLVQYLALTGYDLKIIAAPEPGATGMCTGDHWSQSKGCWASVMGRPPMIFVETTRYQVPVTTGTEFILPSTRAISALSIGSWAKANLEPATHHLYINQHPAPAPATGTYVVLIRQPAWSHTHKQHTQHHHDQHGGTKIVGDAVPVPVCALWVWSTRNQHHYLGCRYIVHTYYILSVGHSFIPGIYHREFQLLPDV